MEDTILIVDDSRMYGKHLKRTIEENLGYRAQWFESFRETERYFNDGGHPAIALLDYTLPDAMDGEIIDLCLRFNIPSVVITSRFSADHQEYLWSKQIVDYVIKEGSHTVGYLLNLITRFFKNPETGILIVDDSKMARNHLINLLHPYRFQLFEAAEAEEALQILETQKDIKLVLADYAMPKCDGFELTKKIRQQWPVEKLAVIGLSAKGSHQLAVKFIKYGANDFLSKPFLSEMLMCRINQNLTLLEHFDSLHELSNIDYLTGIYNRRYLFELGEVIFAQAQRTGDYPVIAMIDIDHFKLVNDNYGHIIGDRVLERLAKTLKLNIRKGDILARYGGEEFCLICLNMDASQVEKIFEKWRQTIAELGFQADGKLFSVTVSIGICMEKRESFLSMVEIGDENLYKAKEAGRNCIRF